MRIPFYLATVVLALKSCTPAPPPVVPVNPAVWTEDCRALYAQELGREPDPGGLTNCTTIIANAAKAGQSPPQEAFRAWVRQQPEWAQHQRDLEAAKVVVPPRQRARGQFIEFETGAKFTVIEATDFALYQKHLDNDPGLDTILAQRESLGFNGVRIFGVGSNPFPGYTIDLTPAKYGDRYYTELAPFHQRLARRGLSSDWIAFIGPQPIVGEAAQLAHWARLVEALRPIPNVRLSAVNEHNAHPLPSLLKLPRPVGIFASLGSNGGAGDGPGGSSINGAAPPQPYWDWIELHTNDTFERARKVGHNCMELSPSKPCVASENTRAGDRMTRVTEAYDSAAGAALLAAGSTFHSVAGRISAPFTGLELELAKAWVAGAKSVPLSCQSGRYRHEQIHIDQEIREGLLRVYQRGDDPACAVRIRR